MMTLDITKRSARSLRGAKVRTFLTVAAIGVGAFSLTLTLGASNGTQRYANKIIINNFDPTELIVSADPNLFSSTDSSKPQTYDQSFSSVTTGAGATTQIKTLTDTDLERLRTFSGVQAVRPAIASNLQYLTRDGQKKYVATVSAYEPYRKPDLLAGSIPATIKSSSVLLPQGFLSALGFHSAAEAVGKPVRLSVTKQVDQSSVLATLLSGDVSQAKAAKSQSEERIFTVIAVTKTPSLLVQPGTGLYLYASEADVMSMNDYATSGTTNYRHYVSAYVKVADGRNAQKLKATQAAIKKAGYGAQSVVDTQKTITQVISVLQGIVTVFGLIAIIASVFGVVNTMYISVLQRTREIGLMKALGMHQRDILKLFLIEASLLGLIGGLVGSLLGLASGVALNPIVSNKLGIGTESLLIFEPIQLIGLVVLLSLIAALAGYLPARKAARLDPITALRIE